MSRSYYRWVIVAAGGLLGCVAIGAMFHCLFFFGPSRGIPDGPLPAIQRHDLRFPRHWHWEASSGETSQTASSAPDSADRIYCLGHSAGAGEPATSLIEFQLIFGLVVGGATAAIFAPMMACVTGWFDTHRSLAVSLVSAAWGWRQ